MLDCFGTKEESIMESGWTQHVPVTFDKSQVGWQMRAIRCVSVEVFPFLGFIFLNNIECRHLKKQYRFPIKIQTVTFSAFAFREELQQRILASEVVKNWFLSF